jgi:hypothetical protein
MKRRKNIIILTVLILCAVNSYFIWQRYKWNRLSYSPEINSVLFMAGDNRPELEKVLKHYGRNPSDRLKLRAAEFLIANMPDKESRYYDAPL